MCYEKCLFGVIFSYLERAPKDSVKVAASEMLAICAVNEKLGCEAVLCGSREETQDPEMEGSSLSPIFDCVSSHTSLPSTVACCYPV